MRAPTSEWPAVEVRLIENDHSPYPRQQDYESDQKPHSTLRRTALDLILLIWGDVLAIFLWCAMLLYALVLWYSHGKREVDLDDGIFSPHLLMEFARPVGPNDQLV